MRARALLAAAAGVAASALFSRAWCALGAEAMFEGKPDAQAPFARAVGRSVCDGARVGTGSAHFDGEWALVAYQFALLGMGQVARAHPREAPALRAVMRRCVGRLMRPDTRAFGAARWREDGVASLGGPHGHAYLGYLALGLGMARATLPDFRFAAEHDALVDALARRIDAAPAGLIETYPGEAYPPDVASVIGAIGLHAAVTGADRRALLARWSAVFRARYVDPRSGYVVQRASLDGAALDAARGSGTAVSAYFLSFADAALARDLAGAVSRGGATLLGFGGVREFPRGVEGQGDIDSGPVILGVSVSGTAFGFASTRLLGDEARFVSLWRTASLFGAPRARGDGWSFRAAGPMGDAILLATMTAEAPR
ncbi:MAG: hypothetical protein R3A48_01630 [Polyangiales bacterium]